jgi:hypothetical protein
MVALARRYLIAQANACITDDSSPPIPITPDIICRLSNSRLAQPNALACSAKETNSAKRIEENYR